MPYFDWNATAPLLPQARDAWLEAAGSCWANASTPYRAGVQARLALDQARATVAAHFKASPEQVVFTSGATESNNGLLREGARRAAPGDTVWLSAIEHPSVRESAHACWGAARVRLIPVLPTGVVDLDWVADHLRREPPALVCVMAANNETGVIQPWPSLLGLCRQAGVPFHCDAVQWIGKHLGTDTAFIGTDTIQGTDTLWPGCAGISVSGHKLGGPKGTGCLVVGAGWAGLTLQAGGAQEHGMRAGTEDVPGILALVAALSLRMANPPPAAQGAGRDLFEAALERAWPGEVGIHGAGAPRLWNTSSVSLPVHRAERWIARLDRRGFQVSSGAACSAGREGPSAVLGAMGVDAGAARRAVRVSGGWETPAGDWEALARALVEIRPELDAGDAPPGRARVISI